MKIGAVEAFALAGPITAVAGLLGIVVLALAIHPHGDGHGDLLIALGIGLILLAAIEWGLARRFAAHEKQETAAQTLMLSSQRADFLAALDTVEQRVSGAIDRMTKVFDSQGDAYMATLREGRATAEKLREIVADVRGLSDRVTRLENRFGIRDVVQPSKEPSP